MENIFERIIKTKYKRELIDLKKQFKTVLTDKELMTKENFENEYPNCYYSINDLKLIIKTINMRLKEFNK